MGGSGICRFRRIRGQPCVPGGLILQKPILEFPLTA